MNPNKFRVIHDPVTTKAANYDRGQVKVILKGSTTILQKNQGVIVKNRKPQTATIDLPQSPALLALRMQARFFSKMAS